MTMMVLEAIARRVSVRTYLPERLEPARLSELLSAGTSAERLTGADIQLHLVVDGVEIDRQLRGLVGDYGKVIRAPHYVVQSAVESPGYLVDCGFRFEQLILAATAAGFGTCWVGAFFQENAIRQRLGLPSGRKVVALTPVGLPAPSEGMTARLLRTMVRGNHRKSANEIFCWQQRGQPLPPFVERELHPVLESVRRSPSYGNRQPWRFVFDEARVVAYKTERLIREGKDYHLVDCGIAMAHLHLAARAIGREGQWLTDGTTAEPWATGNVELLGTRQM